MLRSRHVSANQKSTSRQTAFIGLGGTLMATRIDIACSIDYYGVALDRISR